MKTPLLMIVGLMLAIFCACHKSETPQNTTASFEQLSEQGRALFRKGNYFEGMTLLQAANDSLRAMHPDSVNPEGALKLLGNLSALYARMNLIDEALKANSDAMDIADASVPYRLPDLWRIRGAIFNYANQRDSELVCSRRAVEVCDRIEDEKFRAVCRDRNYRFLLYFYVEYPEFSPEPVSKVVSELEGLSPDNPNDKTIIGYAHVMLGHYSHGLPLLEKAVDIFRQEGDTESVDWAMQLLAKAYTMAGDRKLLDIYNEASTLHDSLENARHDDLLLGMNFKYRISELEKDKIILKSELREKRSGIFYISIIAIIIVAALIGIIIMRRRNGKRLLALKQQDIDNLIAERIALNARIEVLNKSLADSETSPRNQEMIQTILLEKEVEQRFRQNFNDMYPGFIARLRRDYPGLTPGNELLCMLIALHRRNEEIALALGISRESVATSRHRLRSRFNLSRDTDLNDFIQSRL